MQNTNNTHIVKYPLALASRRIVAKIIDILIISILVLCLGFSIFCTDPNFSWNQSLNVSGWRYGLFSCLMAIVFFSLLFLLPLFWKKTIGMKAMKLFYHNKKDHNLVWGLFKHELFVWEIIVFIALLMGIMMSFLNSSQIDSLVNGINSIFAKEPGEGIDATWYYVGTTFSCLYTVSMLFLFAIIIGICIKNNKPSFHDKYSSIYIGYRKIEKDKIKNKSKPKDTGVLAPGMISSEKLEDIDNI